MLLSGCGRSRWGSRIDALSERVSSTVSAEQELYALGLFPISAAEIYGCRLPKMASSH